MYIYTKGYERKKKKKYKEHGMMRKKLDETICPMMKLSHLRAADQAWS